MPELTFDEFEATLPRSKPKWRRVTVAIRRGVKRRKSRQNAGGHTVELGLLSPADPCAYCGDPSEHFDHVEPLFRGGADEPENLTRACRRCNFAKGYQKLIVFLARRAA